MTKQYIQCLIVILLCAVSVTAQSRRRGASSTPRQSVVTDIRRVDFRNFTYQPTQCSRDIEMGRIGKAVLARNGKFKNKGAYFDVVDNIYGDVTGDGRDEAVIHIACGEEDSPASFYISEIFIYTMQNGRATLLAELNDNSMQRDYSRYSPNGELRRITDNGIKIRKGNLVIERFAEGSMSMPDYIVALEYRWDGASLILNSRPQKRVFRT